MAIALKIDPKFEKEFKEYAKSHKLTQVELFKLGFNLVRDMEALDIAIERSKDPNRKKLFFEELEKLVYAD